MGAMTKKARAILHTVGALEECVSELSGLSLSESDLLRAMGPSPRRSGGEETGVRSADLEQFLYILVNSLEARYDYTRGHIERVMRLGLILGERLGLKADELEELKRGCVLHDIGKIGLSSELLNKSGPLDPGEQGLLKKHPEIGYQLCLPLQGFLGRALDIIRQHHEKLDGSGYPLGLSGGDIYRGTRIVTVVDIFDALTSDRSYCKGIAPEMALDVIRREAEEGKLDGDVVESLCGCVRDIFAL